MEQLLVPKIMPVGKQSLGKNIEIGKKQEKYLVKSVLNYHGKTGVKTAWYISQFKLIFSPVYPKINILCSCEHHNKITFV